MGIAIAPSNILLDIGIIIIVSTLFAYFARLLKQPLIPAYILAGLIFGPIGFGLVKDPEVIKNLSEIGIAFLLFIVGLEIDMKKLRKVGLVASVGGFIQVVLTFALSFGIATLLGFSKFEASLIGFVLAFSSTMIVVKLFSDKEELATLHGRVIVGILIMQDVLVILAIAMLQGQSPFSLFSYLLIFAKGLLIIAVAFVTSKFIIPRIFKFAASSAETLFLSSIAVCFLFSMLALALGFSIAIGAFIGGLVVANLPYHFDIIGRIKPLRDFFSTIFFSSLGMQIATFDWGGIMLPLAAFLGITVIAKPLILFIIVNFFGYGKRVSFITGLSMAQISEFSLILVMLSKESISPDIFSITIILGIITIVATSYLVKYDEYIYNRLSRYLAVFERNPTRFEALKYEKKDRPEIILFGCHRMGSVIMESLRKHKVFVIDHNPEVISKLMAKKTNCMYGDVSNIEILRRVNFKDAKIAISTLPHAEDNIILIQHAKKENPKIKVFVTSNHLHEAIDLYEQGADYVILPPIVSGERISHFLEKAVHKKAEFEKIRKKHLKHLLMLNAEK